MWKDKKILTPTAIFLIFAFSFYIMWGASRDDIFLYLSGIFAVLLIIMILKLWRYSEKNKEEVGELINFITQASSLAIIFIFLYIIVIINITGNYSKLSSEVALLIAVMAILLNTSFPQNNEKLISEIFEKTDDIYKKIEANREKETEEIQKALEIIEDKFESLSKEISSLQEDIINITESLKELKTP